MIKIRLFYLSVVAFAFVGATLYGAPVKVMLVEADVSSDEGLQYAPVNFAGDTTKTSGGVTYHALSDPGSDTVSTYSWHANNVRNRLLAADGANNPVQDIYSLYADDFLDNYVQTYIVYDNNLQYSVLPNQIGNDIKIVNNSWVSNSGSTGANTDAVRRMDYMIRREDLVMVSGAVARSSGEALAWSSRNGISVRGTQSFNPSYNNGAGKTHADLWGPKTGSGNDEVSSYETPGVAGYAAALIDVADTNGWNNGTNGMRHEVVKSLLMTGADKTDFSTNGFTSWSRDTSNNLDKDSGAGRANYENSLRVLNGGQQSVSSVSGTTINSPTITGSMAGWTYETLAGLDSQALVFDLTDPYMTGLTATLAWDVTQQETSYFGNPTLDTTEAGEIFADLDLELLPVIVTDGTYSFGDSLGIPGLESKVINDNLEHLYFTGDTLDSGLYAFVLSNKSDFDWNYGFSYTINAIPEPTTVCLLLLGGACVLLRRRGQPSLP